MDIPLDQIGLGGLTSPRDYRDDIATASMAATLSAVTLPASYGTDLTPLGPVLMQAKEPACVSHSVALMLKLYFYRKTGVVHNFSPRFLDTLVKRFDGQDRATGGTFPRLVMKMAVQYGCATEDALPNDTTLPVLEYRDDSKLTPAVFANAAQFKLPGYIKVPNDLQSTRASILLYGCISTLFEVGKELYTAPDGTVTWSDAQIDPMRTPAVIESGHQMTPKAWHDNFNVVRNSWSEAWANHGEAGYNVADWAPFTIEQWAPAEIPPDTVTFLQSLPSAADFHYTWNTDLHLGNFNDDVKFLQVALMQLGFLSPISASDLGHYGSKTSVAVSKYQISQRISPSPANVGPKTRAALNAQFAV